MWLLFQRIISEDVLQAQFFSPTGAFDGLAWKDFRLYQVSKLNCWLEKNWKISSFWCESPDNYRCCPPSDFSQHLFSRLNCSPPLWWFQEQPCPSLATWWLQEKRVGDVSRLRDSPSKKVCLSSNHAGHVLWFNARHQISTMQSLNLITPHHWDGGENRKTKSEKTCGLR